MIGPDKEARDLYEFSLQQVGLSVRQARGLGQCLSNWADQPADLVLVLEPEEAEIISSIRTFRQESTVPFLIIAEGAPLSQQLAAVRAGADMLWDYAVDPRLCAAYCLNLLRRSGGLPGAALPPLSLGGITLDPSTRTFKLGESESGRLTQLEFKLLYLLMSHKGQVIPTPVLIEKVWGYDDYGSSDLVRGLVSRLRTKLRDSAEAPRFIETIPGVGYRLRTEA